MPLKVKTILVSLSAVLVLVAGTVVGTNLVTAEPVSSPGPVTVTFNYNGATGGNTLPSDTVTSGTQADDELPFPTKPGVTFSGWFNTQSLLNGQRITTIEESDAGTLMAGYVPLELAQTLNLVLPPAPCAQGGACALGDIGPGGGLVFLISGGKTYEMAPKAWSGSGTPDARVNGWVTNTPMCYDIGSSTADKECQHFSLYPETTPGSQIASAQAARAIGMGSANTNAIIARMNAGGVASSAYAAGAARAWNGGGYNDWFLPSKDELSAMYTYKLVMPAGMLATYGFIDDPVLEDPYWSSSEYDDGYNFNRAYTQHFDDRGGSSAFKPDWGYIRPIRSF